jgi:hypothetical protein
MEGAFFFFLIMSAMGSLVIEYVESANGHE